jgi:hypothetical protein
MCSAPANTTARALLSWNGWCCVAIPVCPGPQLAWVRRLPGNTGARPGNSVGRDITLSALLPSSTRSATTGCISFTGTGSGSNCVLQQKTATGVNWGVLDSGEPVIFDPAVYYGDRETDIAMTELFGGFPSEFYAAYQQAYPLDPGYRVRRDLYNLYHLLNHLNLFGEGYLSQTEGLINRLVSAT